MLSEKYQNYLVKLDENLWLAKLPVLIVRYIRNNQIEDEVISIDTIKSSISNIEEFLKFKLKETKSQYKDLVIYRPDTWEVENHFGKKELHPRIKVIDRE